LKKGSSKRKTSKREQNKGRQQRKEAKIAATRVKERSYLKAGKGNKKEALILFPGFSCP